MKYALIGSAGQLGRDITPRLIGDVIPLTRAQTDLTNPDTLRAELSALKPDVVVNCAAANKARIIEALVGAGISILDFRVEEAPVDAAVVRLQALQRGRS